jgi:ABC-2 type transport system ATP-binding protein
VRENVRFFTGLHGLDYNQHHAHFDHLFERFGLNSVTEELVMNLSTGMKQKVAVVCALAKQTDLVFLDEPTLGLDIETSIELRKVLRDLARESGRTIVLSSHDMDVIQAMCERVIIIKDGRIIVDDSVDNLLALFSTRSYRVVLSGAAGESLLEQLAVLVPEVTLKPHGVNTELQFSLPSPQRLYDVIEVLRESGVLIETIGQRQPDLEEAFLHIIRGDRQQLAE